MRLPRHRERDGQPRRGRIATLLAAALVAAALPALAAPAAASAAPSPNGPWHKVDGKPAPTKAGKKATVNAKRLSAFTLDRASLKGTLDKAPRERGKAARQQRQIVSLPAPDGTLQRFELVNSPVMEAGLAAKHPEITTYAGQGLDDPTATIRADLTPLGFHASVRSAAGNWYVDPYYHLDESLYASYFARDLENPHGEFVEREDVASEAHALADEIATAQAEVPAGPLVKLRTYRVALVTDPSYANFFGAENVTAAKVTLMNRVTQIYEDETAIRLVLINDTDKTNLNTPALATEPNGPCGAAACFTTAQISSCGSSTLSRNRIVLGQIVGASNYDVGHIGLGVNGGGIASLGVIGGGSKAQGCTGLPQPTGDFYAVDYVAHEMGHQFAGNHTFNGTQYNCSGGNRSAANSYEPGSGSSIMAYAGICQQDNLQPHTDPYWSHRSYTEITTYVTSNRAAISEVQTASLYDFDANGDSFRVRYNGNDSAPIVRGGNYTTAGIKAAIEGIAGWPAGATVTVAAFGGSGTLNDTGFQVTFGGTLANTNVAALELTDFTGASGFVGETAKGGAIDNGGFLVEDTANHAPVVTVPGTVTIPVRTPFALTGSATDVDGDTVTYMWEQNDRGASAGTALVNNTKTNGPLFRVFGEAANVSPEDTLKYHSPGQNAVTTDSTRIFPDMKQILAGNTNAKTGACPAAPAPPPTGGASNVPAEIVDCFSEFLPTKDWVGFSNDRTLHFKLTARDGRLGGGGIGSADVAVALAPNAGPFLVTSQGSAAVLDGGSSQTVTWDVAGTDAAPVNASQVKISLSADGGQTFPYVLAESTPNNGSATVTLPNVATKQARIKIEAVGNIFFDVNDADLTVRSAPVVTNDAPAGGARVQYSDALSPTVTVSATDGDTAGTALTASAAGLPAGLSLAVAATSGTDTLPGTRSWTVAGTTTAAPGTYPVTVTVSDGTGLAGSTSFTVTVTAEDAAATWAGDTLVSTATSGASGKALLRAVVQDSSVLPSATDTTAGDIRNATVTFTEGGVTLCTGTVELLGAATTSASAACEVALPAGTHTVTATVGGYYTGSTTAQVTVAVSDGGFLTGDGEITVDRSAGAYPADAKSKVAVNLTGKPATANKAASGQAEIAFRSGGKSYTIKAGTVDGLGITSAGKVAQVRYQASLYDSNGKVVASGLTLAVTVTDRGAPGRDDTVGITLWNGGALLFSSDWTGNGTGEVNLTAGNLTVH
ncbi:M12 family metallo-peptidase [Micromonospora narathiwatensis]|uniref:Metallo-peptidase family M12B Reprolysin-like n=1 Tax=Micromonospora narathiwatensis TaxID=299146 RepID=A0A1A8ZV19_9ACTN|nr:M12 family metallo-peptidase [Micromonospora narathiwatensis]SBT47681.1 Metallo-peptidase family M12B Reprolysin-like [Micromonospora narathiwatensis]